MLAERLVLDGQTGLAADRHLLRLVAHNQSRFHAEGVGAKAVAEAGVGQGHLELEGHRGSRGNLTLGEAKLGAQSGVAEIGDGLAVAGIVDGVSLPVEFGGELGAGRGHIAEADNRAIDTGALLKRPGFGEGQEVRFFPDGHAEDVERHVSRRGNEGAGGQHRTGLGRSGGSGHHEAGESYEAAKREHSVFPLGI